MMNIAFSLTTCPLFWIESSRRIIIIPIVIYVFLIRMFIALIYNRNKREILNMLNDNLAIGINLEKQQSVPEKLIVEFQ